MKFRLPKIEKNTLLRALIVTLSIAANVGVSYLMHISNVPLHFDVIGTIFVASLCGAFPGIITAVASSVFCASFNPLSIYFTLISVLIAISAAQFTRMKLYMKKMNIPLFILWLSFLGGGLGTVFQFILTGGPQFSEVRDIASLVTGGHGFLYLLVSALINIGLNLIDKSVSTAVAVIVIYMIPQERRDYISSSGWLQKPLTDEQIKKVDSYSMGSGESMRARMSRMLVFVALAVAFAMAYISISQNTTNTRQEYTDNAINTAKLAAAVIDPDKVEEYRELGYDAEGYAQTRELLTEIRNSMPGVMYLYVVSIENEGCRFIFDVDSPEGVDAYEPGDFTPFEEGFTDYVPALKAGEMIEPLETDDSFGWLLTAYYPVKNAAGETVCYTGADVSMDYLSGYTREFGIRSLLMFSGFFVLILGYGFWVSGHHLIYPIGSMTRCAEGFMQDIGDQEALDERVRTLRKLDIHTGDEVERLYKDMCEMAAGTAEQMRDIRYYTESTTKMQNGLIITMADMVENRDSDTGAHIQKTAAYVRIILDGLKEKGYYAEKLTPKYMAAVEMSAPLHDVGKINISDTILNKPGKLTDEEYEIMKTHTTHGKQIMEQAISTVNGENYLKEARNMAAYHHERWDGKGYPEKLHGQVIPLSARIMAVADVFDALTSRRVYKPPFTMEKALEIIQDGAGTQFDPKCVEVFIDSLDKVQVVLKKYQEA